MSSSFESLQEWILAGVDGILLKTATYRPRTGYDFPVVAAQDKTLIQAMGLPNPGYEKMGLLARKLKESYPETFVISSFTTADENEMTEMICFLGNQSDAMEYNISCPHANGLGCAIGYDFELLGKLCKIIKKYCKKPFGLKMPYYPTDELLRGCIEAADADFYTNINSVGKAMMLGKVFGVSNKFGGLSGPSIKPLALGQVYRTRKLTDKFIFGSGGVMNRKDVAEFLKAGADGVQLGSGILNYITKKDFVEEARNGFSYDIENYFKNIDGGVFQ